MMEQLDQQAHKDLKDRQEMTATMVQQVHKVQQEMTVQLVLQALQAQQDQQEQ